ncbi:MAG: hypothetical protein ACTSYA_03200 [Candidatus Kariarchaeaceae archaeon]
MNKLILIPINILLSLISVWLTSILIFHQFPINLGIYGKLYRYIELIFVSVLLLNHVYTTIKGINQELIVLRIVLYYFIIFISFFDFFFFLIIVMPLVFPSFFLDLLLVKVYYNSQQELKVNNTKIVQGFIMVVFLLIAYIISAILAINAIETYYQSDGFIGYDIFAFSLISTYNLSTFSSIVSAGVCFIACSLFSLKAFDGAYGKKRFDGDISFNLKIKSKEVKVYWLDLAFLSTLVLALLSRFFYILIEFFSRISKDQDFLFAIRRSLIIGIPGLGVLIIILFIYYFFEKLANQAVSENSISEK